ncbi:MAG: hypothetical protein JWR26_1873 [Pedosphaera sp.]|nr:hypothetical protein [Pedosphaera sp.]
MFFQGACARPPWGWAGKGLNGGPRFENGTQPPATTRGSFIFCSSGRERVPAHGHYEEGEIQQPRDRRRRSLGQPSAGWGVYGEDGLVEKHLRGGRLHVLRAGCPRSVGKAGLARGRGLGHTDSHGRGGCLRPRMRDSLRSSLGSTDWLPKPCQSGAHKRRSLREKQSLPTNCWMAGAGAGAVVRFPRSFGKEAA